MIRNSCGPLGPDLSSAQGVIAEERSLATPDIRSVLPYGATNPVTGSFRRKNDIRSGQMAKIGAMHRPSNDYGDGDCEASSYITA